MRLTSLLSLLSAALLGATPVWAASTQPAPRPKPQLFTEVVEAEAMKRTGTSFVVDTDAAGVVHIAPATDRPAVPGGRNPQTSDAITHTFTAPVAGLYYIWGRISAPNHEGDSFFVKVGESRKHWVIQHEPANVTFDAHGDWISWNHTVGDHRNTWTWSRVDLLDHPINPTHLALAFRLEAGPHTLWIARRDNGARLDKIIITNRSEFRPEGPDGVPVRKAAASAK